MVWRRLMQDQIYDLLGRPVHFEKKLSPTHSIPACCSSITSLQNSDDDGRLQTVPELGRFLALSFANG